MRIDDLTDILVTCCNDVSFIHNGMKSGVIVTVKNGIPTWKAWHGDNTKEYTNIKELLSDKFYSGNSIIDIAESTEFIFS